MGYRSVRWTYHPGGGIARKVAHRTVHRAVPGSIISLDVWRRSHRDALPAIINGLRRKGFELRTLNALSNAHPIRWDVTLNSGDSGPEVKYLQKILRNASYPAGKLDSQFEYPTLMATYAFERFTHTVLDGVVTPAEMTAIALARRPTVSGRTAESFIDVDVSKQLAFEVHHHQVRHTIPISSGSEQQYTVDGQTYTAHTPRGDFSIERKIPGWRTSRLGRLWYPSYFTGGYALHGSPSVPNYPASHGCIRMPMYLTKKFYYRNPIGTPVFVHD
jgi:lipoprotein-anchoring transpeptidase ErfK/SrfK